MATSMLAAQPRKAAAGNDRIESCIAATTRARPALITASTHGGVRP
jgi:hypothetical protein